MSFCLVKHDNEVIVKMLGRKTKMYNGCMSNTGHIIVTNDTNICIIQSNEIIGYSTFSELDIYDPWLMNFNSNGSMLLIAYYKDNEPYIKVFKFCNGKLYVVATLTNKVLPNSVHADATAWLDNTNIILISQRKGFIYKCNPLTLQIQPINYKCFGGDNPIIKNLSHVSAQFGAHNYLYYNTTFTPSAQLIDMGDDNNAVLIDETATRAYFWDSKKLKQYNLETYAHICDIDIEGIPLTINGKYIITYDNTCIRVYSTLTKKIIQSYECNLADTNSVCILNNNTLYFVTHNYEHHFMALLLI